MDAGGRFFSKIFNPENPNSAVKFDEISYTINNKRVMLVSGEFQYPRIPQEQWKDRIEIAKQAGINTIQTYIFWNVHEPEEGKWRFDGYRDIEQFIKIVKDAGMYLVLRIGPYVNAERDNGGFPNWLSQYDCKVRVNDAVYMEKVLLYYNKIISIIKQYTVKNNGPLIIVQYENEVLWQESMPALLELRKHIASKIDDVILIESGLYHQGELTMADGKHIYHNTELWTGWLYRWGENILPAQLGVNTVSKMFEGLARGVDGFNYYVYSGGTNFDYSQSAAYPTCYELGESPLNEQGAPTRLYYDTKIVNSFINSFMEELSDSTGFLDENGVYAGDDCIKTNGFVHSNIRGTKFFFGFDEGFSKNVLDYEIETAYSKEKPVSFAFNFECQGEIFDYAGPGIAYRDANHICLWGYEGGAIKFRVRNRNFTIFVDSADFFKKLKIDGGKVFVYVAGVEAAKRIFASQNGLGTGADIIIDNNHIGFVTNKKKKTVSSGDRKNHIELDLSKIARKIEIKKMEIFDGCPESNLGFGEKGEWKKFDYVPDIDEIAPAAGYAWYKFIINQPKECVRVITLADLKDQATVFLNGKFHTISQPPQTFDGSGQGQVKFNFSFPMAKGCNEMTILLKSWGRYKGFDVGDVTLKKAGQTKGFSILAKEYIGMGDECWVSGGLAIESNRFEQTPYSDKGVCRLYKVTFDLEEVTNKTLHGGLRFYMGVKLTHGSMWLNGRHIGLYYNKGIEKTRGYNLPWCWLKEKNNEFWLFEDGDGVFEGSFIAFDTKSTYYIFGKKAILN